MRCAAFFSGFALLVPCLAGQSAHDALLARARDVISQHILQLPKYTCTAVVDRTYFRVTRGAASTCDKILGNRDRGVAAHKPIATDRLRLDVEIADGGYELFSWPGASFTGVKIEDLADGGPIGTGSFGAFLIDIFANRGVEFQAQAETTIGGRPAMEYRFRVPLEASHYKAGLRGSYGFIAYDGHIWIDPASAELLRLEVRTAELPADSQACEATTRVDLARLPIGEADYLAPVKSVLGVIGRYGDDSESVTAYSACHEFRGESTVRFDDAPGPSAAPPLLHAAVQALPPDVPVSVTFDTPIDTNTVAAGDRLRARVAKDAVDPATHKMLLRAGSPLEGRIVHVEHHLNGKDYFILSVVFDAPHLIPNHAGRIAWVDKSTPCWMSLRKWQAEGYSWRASQSIESQGRLSAGGTFLLPSRGGRYLMPKGCLSQWVTAK